MIKQISLNNFKCFLSTDVPLANLTVLAGINSVGKSTIIQALLLIRQTYDKIKSLSDDTLRGPSYVNISLNNEYCLQLGTTREVLCVDAKTEDISFMLFGDDGKGFVFTYKVEKDIPSLHLGYHYHMGTDFQRYGFPIFNSEFHYLNTERVGPRIIHDIIDWKYPNTGFRGEYSGYVVAELSEEKVDERKRIINPSQTVPNLNKQVDYWLDYVIPGIDFQHELYPKISKVGIGLQRRGTGTGFLNPNNLGFGISSILPIIVSGLIAPQGSMLIVENPELHLHPSAQSRIGQFLAQVSSAGVQVIIETHSEHVINGIRIAALKKLVPFDQIALNYFNHADDLKTTVVQPIYLNEEAELNIWPKGFLDQEQQDLRALIHLRKGQRK